MSKSKNTRQTQSANPEVVNWLERLDAHALTLTPLQDWRDFDYFLLVRYPHLQPISPPGPDVSVLPPQMARRFFENSKRVFYEMLADYEEEIATHDEAKRALEDLTEKQRQTLLAELNGMPQEEIGRRMGSNRNAVYKLAHDARKRLKQGLEAAGYTVADMESALGT